MEKILVSNHEHRVHHFPEKAEVEAEHDGTFAVFEHPTNEDWFCTADGYDGIIG